MRWGVTIRLLWLAAAMFAALAPVHAGSRVVYPQWASGDTRQVFYFNVLKLALGKVEADTRLQPSQTVMNQGRALKQLAGGRAVDVVWSMTSRAREAELLPVRIPLDMGLIGCRIFLIRKQHANAFSNVRNLEDMKVFTAGQGHDWPDTEILRANGLPVDTSANYEGMFEKLQLGRFDYFPRSVTEIWDEARSHAEMELVVEEHVVLQYPAAFYFFVNRNNKTLAAKIEAGLHQAIQDGSFRKLFMEEFGQDIERARLKQRTLIKLANPLLTPETPLQDRNLWFEF